MAKNRSSERFWSSTETETIINNWKTKSGSQLAEELQRSRCSVMGKVMRLTDKGLLPPGVKKHYSSNPRASIVRRASIVPRLPKPPPLAPVIVETELHKLLNSNDPPPPAPAADVGCSILELTSYSCRWPISADPTSPDFRYCGSPKLRGVSYCPHHAKIAYGKDHR